VKKFFFLRYHNRGKPFSEGGAAFMRNALHVVVATIALQVSLRPLKSLEHDFFVQMRAASDAAEAEAIAAHTAVVRAPGQRPHFQGIPLGMHSDHGGVGADGQAIGVGPEQPSPVTGRVFADFALDDRVLAWWWNSYYQATIRARSVTSQTVTVCWFYDGTTTAGYLPSRLLRWPDGLQPWACL
jgi:hypothetical protein